MIYEFACDKCEISMDVERHPDQCGDPAFCPVCGNSARRVFGIPALLGRQKPVSFRWDKKKMNAWDDRLAGFKHAESQGTAALAKLKAAFGNQVYGQVKTHLKENYVS